MGDTAAPAVSEEAKAKAEAQAAEKASAAAESGERFVQYLTPLRAANNTVTRPSGAGAGDGSPASRVGVASAESVITAAQWKQVGVEATGDVVWNFDNNWRVPASELSKAQIDYLLTTDRRYNGKRFELVDAAGKAVNQ